MTAGLSGAGTDGNPWLIATRADLRAVVRDSVSSGYYRVTADLSSVPGAESGLEFLTEISVRYGPKVIRGDGFGIGIKFAFINAGSTELHCLRNIHFEGVSIHFRFMGGAANALHYFDNCSFEDVAFYVESFSASGIYFSGYMQAYARAALVARVMRRVTMARLPIESVATWRIFNTTDNQPVAEDCYTLQSGTETLPVGFSRINSLATFTVAGIKTLSAAAGAAYEQADWDSAGSYLLPTQTDAVVFLVSTLVDGQAISRPIYAELRGRIALIGDTDSAGYAELPVRLSKRAAVTLFAGEDLAARQLTANLYVESGVVYLPPADNGYVYRAGSAGTVGSLVGIVFGATPVTISGIVFTPVNVHSVIASPRFSVARNGTAITAVLERSSGGGPVIEGDPAYLDGVTEEVHPMLGTVRPLANAEVFAFERRGSEFVPMGSAFSNTIGEFRVETDVYGGGDIFAFAADFPGVVWQAAATLSLGDRVRPTENNGYVYEIITAGNSGATEPAWWADAGDGTEGAIGSATAKARPYYQPVGHGPLKMTHVE